MSDGWIKAPCIPVTQPIGVFYLAVMSHTDLLSVAYSDVRRPQDSLFEKVTGIQRETTPARVREISQYVRNVDATFPTSIIVSIGHADAKYTQSKHEITIRKSPEVALVIDGQHRLAGLQDFVGEFELNVVIFVDMELEDQAMTFATINLAQTKVNRSLVFDLYEYQTFPSPYKTCHAIARLLNREPKSPLFKRLKILGRATGEELQFITQATFVTELVKYISNDPMGDRNAFRKGSVPDEATPAESELLVMRSFFLSRKDEEIAKVIWNYFDAVASRWPTAWNSDEEGNILNRTMGFQALMRFLGPVYRTGRDSRGRLPRDKVLEILKTIKLRDSEITRQEFEPGGGGLGRLTRRFREDSQIE